LNKADLNGTLVKADIVDQVYEKVGFTRQEAAQAVEVLFNEIKKLVMHAIPKPEKRFVYGPGRY